MLTCLPRCQVDAVEFLTARLDFLRAEIRRHQLAALGEFAPAAFVTFSKRRVHLKGAWQRAGSRALSVRFCSIGCLLPCSRLGERHRGF